MGLLGERFRGPFGCLDCRVGRATLVMRRIGRHTATVLVASLTFEADAGLLTFISPAGVFPGGRTADSGRCPHTRYGGKRGETLGLVLPPARESPGRCAPRSGP